MTNPDLIAPKAYIALGANLGKPLSQLDSAAQALQKCPDIECVAMSKVYATKPHGPQDQPDYTNAVLEISTTLTPIELLDVIHAIEKENGRVRNQRWGARTLDLDIILYGDISLETEKLTIPHPRAHEREFVIGPLADLDNTLLIPPYGSVSELKKQLPIHTMEVIRNVTTYNS
ncbi:MAG: 2-amino-4-hydroxy-6-hydroxymethyldihydropteridine diphosphokinase [Gammaproteobacteria bacterium]|nr:2-amino-4-hydroxy-6-hydroxymethyldihydropteridine diphosphokinase [Gammaproteobacteria bacterium]